MARRFKSHYSAVANPQPSLIPPTPSWQLSADTRCPALTKQAEPVVDGDDDHLAEAGEHAAVVQVARRPEVRVAVDVYHDRVQVGAACGRGQTGRLAHSSEQGMEVTGRARRGSRQVLELEMDTKKRNSGKMNVQRFSHCGVIKT